VTSDGVLDPDTVAELRRAQQHYDNPTFIRQLVEIFRENAPAKMARLREAVARRDPSALERVAHTLKSNCGMLGATAMAGMCARLEDAGGRAAFSEAEAVLGEAEREFPRVLEAVEGLGDATPEPP
jgi:HPt (histidine-containing phosphotransfer) domain-containing protein